MRQQDQYRGCSEMSRHVGHEETRIDEEVRYLKTSRNFMPYIPLGHERHEETELLTRRGRVELPEFHALHTPRAHWAPEIRSSSCVSYEKVLLSRAIPALVSYRLPRRGTTDGRGL